VRSQFFHTLKSGNPSALAAQGRRRYWIHTSLLIGPFRRHSCCFCRKLSATDRSLPAGILDSLRHGEQKNSEMLARAG